MDQLLVSVSLGQIDLAGQAADAAAGGAAFRDYLDRKSLNTRRRQADDLQCFANFLQAAGVAQAPAGAELMTTPECWRGITWGLVAAFVHWQLGQGFAVSSVNVRLSTVRTYARLAAQAGVLDAGALAMVLTVKGYSPKEARRIDAERSPCRRGNKKASATVLSPTQVEALKRQPDTPQGRRDAVLVCLMVEQGLRVGEVVGLMVTDLALEIGRLTFWREKVSRRQTHQLTPVTWQAMRRYLAADQPPAGRLLRGSDKTGRLCAQGMTRAAIYARIAELGRRVGIAGLCPHDLRHTWATLAARAGTPLDRLQEAGGWSSLAMPLRYIQAAQIANAGVVLGGE